MKLIMTLVVRDEEDILEENLAYHLSRGVSFVIAMDHRSQDATPEILARFEARGLLASTREEALDFPQSRWTTRMAARAFELGADWVLNNDADEFWWPLEDDLPSAFEKLDEDADYVRVPRFNFVPLPGSSSFPERLTVRETRSANALGRPLPPKVSHRARADVSVAPGGHRVHSVRGRPLRAAAGSETLQILHFPMRSLAQFERKVVNLGAAHLRSRHPGRPGAAARRLYALHRAGRLAEYYDTHVPTRGELCRRLADGSLVEDRRLRDYLRLLPRGGPEREGSG